MNTEHTITTMGGRYLVAIDVGDGRVCWELVENQTMPSTWKSFARCQ